MYCDSRSGLPSVLFQECLTKSVLRNVSLQECPCKNVSLRGSYYKGRTIISGRTTVNGYFGDDGDVSYQSVESVTQRVCVPFWM